MVNFNERAICYTKVFCPNVSRQNIDVGFRGIHLVSNVHVFGAVHQVCNVTGPAAHIGASQNDRIRHSLHLGIIGHIHCTEYMTEVNSIPVGQCEVFDVLQCRSRSVACGILLGNIGGKGGILFAADHFPSAGGIPFHTCTDIVDDQRIGILTSIFFRIGLGITLQNLEAGKECCIV